MTPESAVFPFVFLFLVVVVYLAAGRAGRLLGDRLAASMDAGRSAGPPAESAPPADRESENSPSARKRGLMLPPVDQETFGPALVRSVIERASAFERSSKPSTSADALAEENLSDPGWIAHRPEDYAKWVAGIRAAGGDIGAISRHPSQRGKRGDMNVEDNVTEDQFEVEHAALLREFGGSTNE